MFLCKIEVSNILILSHSGQEKVDDATDKAGLTIPNTAPRGQEIIREEISSLKEQFDITFTTSVGSQSQLGKNYLIFFNNHSIVMTRKSSCVNARGIPTAAYQVLICYPRWGTPPPSQV